MPKKGSQFRGWRYTCLTCGFSTLDIGAAVDHVNKNKGHQLKRVEL